MGKVIPFVPRSRRDVVSYNQQAQAVASAYLSKLALYGEQGDKRMRYQAAYRRRANYTLIAFTVEFRLDGTIYRSDLVAQDQPDQPAGTSAIALLGAVRANGELMQVGEAIVAMHELIAKNATADRSWEIWEYFLDNRAQTGWIQERVIKTPH